MRFVQPRPRAQACGEAEGSRADPCPHPVPTSGSGSLSGLHHSPCSANPEGGLEAPRPGPELLGSDTEDTGDGRAPCDGQPFRALWSTAQRPWPLHARCPTPSWDNRNYLQTLPRLPWGAQLLSSLSCSAPHRPPEPLTCGTRDSISTTEAPLTEEPPWHPTCPRGAPLSSSHPGEAQALNSLSSPGPRPSEPGPPPRPVSPRHMAPSSRRA